jgi:hypothetical protein
MGMGGLQAASVYRQQLIPFDWLNKSLWVRWGKQI